jgi:hypothetical protein
MRTIFSITKSGRLDKRKHCLKLLGEQASNDSKDITLKIEDHLRNIENILSKHNWALIFLNNSIMGSPFPNLWFSPNQRVLLCMFIRVTKQNGSNEVTFLHFIHCEIFYFNLNLRLIIFSKKSIIQQNLFISIK